MPRSASEAGLWTARRVEPALPCSSRSPPLPWERPLQDCCCRPRSAPVVGEDTHSRQSCARAGLVRPSDFAKRPSGALPVTPRDQVPVSARPVLLEAARISIGPARRALLPTLPKRSEGPNTQDLAAAGFANLEFCIAHAALSQPAHQSRHGVYRLSQPLGPCRRCCSGMRLGLGRRRMCCSRIRALGSAGSQCPSSTCRSSLPINQTTFKGAFIGQTCNANIVQISQALVPGYHRLRLHAPHASH